MKDVKVNIKKYIKLGAIVAAAYVAGRISCFIDMVKKYEDNITLDELDMGFFGTKRDFAGIGWIRPKKED